MKRNNLMILALSSVMLFSCGVNEEVKVRTSWNDDEKTKIETLLFEGSAKYVTCFVYEEVAINSFTSTQENFKKGIEVTSKKANDKAIEAFEKVLTTNKYVKDNNLFILTIDESKYFTCESTLTEGTFKYNISYFEVAKAPKPEQLKARTKWTDVEKGLIDSLLFEESSKLVPCYVFEEVTIENLTSDKENFKKGIEVTSKKANNTAIEEFEKVLTTNKFVKENDEFKLVIDDTKYLTCSASLVEGTFEYEVYYFEIAKTPEVPATGWTDKEKAIITKAYGEEYVDLMPSYALNDRVLIDDTEEYNCLTLTSKTAAEEDLAKFISSLEILQFEYNEVGDFYFKFIDETNLKFIGIQAYFDPVDGNIFTIDYYLTTLNDSTNIIETWTTKDEGGIVSSFTIDVLDFIPCYVTSDYTIIPTFQENMMTIVSNGTFGYFNDYMQVFEDFGYTLEVTEDGVTYYTIPFEEGSMDVFFNYDVEGNVEVNIYYLTGKAPVEARKEWTQEEIALINETFGEEVSQYIPCLMFETSTLKVVENHLVIEDLEVSENALIEAQAYFLEQEFEPDFDTNTYEKIIENHGKVQLIPDFTDKFTVEIYYIKEAAKPTDNITSDIKILPNQFNAQYVGSESSIEFSGMNCLFNDIMYTDNRMQFKRESSYIYNINELPKINSIKVERVLKGFEPADNEELTFYKSNNGVDYEVVTRDENFVYDFSGATYFKITNESLEYAQSLKFIEIDFLEL